MANINTVRQLLLHPKALFSAVTRKIKNNALLKRIYHYIANLLHINYLATRISKLENNLNNLNNYADVSVSIVSEKMQAINRLLQDLQNNASLAEIRNRQAGNKAIHRIMAGIENQLIEECGYFTEHYGDYTSIIRTVQQNSEQMLYVLDLGCGRGHWLKALEKENNISGLGVDINQKCVEDCLNKNLLAARADILPYLRNCQSASVDIVTMFHVADYLSIDELIDVLSEVFRVLRSGGLLIVEMPDPEKADIQGYCAFCDPSLVTVIYPEVLSMLAGQSGLVTTETLRFSPPPVKDCPEDDKSPESKNPHLAFGPFASYAVVAVKSVKNER